MRKVQGLIAFLFVLAFLFSSVLMVKAACPESDYDCQISEIQNIINTITPAHERNKAELAKLKTQLADIQKSVFLRGKTEDFFVFHVPSGVWRGNRIQRGAAGNGRNPGIKNSRQRIKNQ